MAILHVCDMKHSVSLEVEVEAKYFIIKTNDANITSVRKDYCSFHYEKEMEALSFRDLLSYTYTIGLCK